jgi:uncharacterized protein
MRFGRIETSTFRAAWWLRNAHAQTLWSTPARAALRVATRSERLELADGDCVDLFWSDSDGSCKPTVLLLHGLEGAFDSPYMRGMMQTIVSRGWRAVAMNFRNCGTSINRLPRSYHAGDTGDVAAVAEVLRQRFASSPLFAVGYSLGGNVLLKWLGESGSQNPLRAAAAVSVPFDLGSCARCLNRGSGRFYQAIFLRQLKESLARKVAALGAAAFPIGLEAAAAIADLEAWDEQVTAPLHGFAGAEDYYRRCSSEQFLGAIEQPTLVVHALDDPFMLPTVVPSEKKLSAQVCVEVSASGGHVGFVAGKTRPEYWLESRLLGFFDGFVEEACA